MCHEVDAPGSEQMKVELPTSAHPKTPKTQGDWRNQNERAGEKWRVKLSVPVQVRSVTGVCTLKQIISTVDKITDCRM